MSARCYDENCMVHFLELESSFAHVSPQFGNVRCLCSISDKETWRAALAATLAYRYRFLEDI
jgi:hypothetical protein